MHLNTVKAHDNNKVLVIKCMIIYDNAFYFSKIASNYCKQQDANDKLMHVSPCNMKLLNGLHLNFVLVRYVS